MGALYSSLFDSWQENIIDKFFVGHAASNEIVVFAIDNESINQIGQWPWPRKNFAQALDKLQSAKVVGVDVNFSEPSRYGLSDDQSLASTLFNAKSIVVLPVQVNTATKEQVEPLSIFKTKSSLGLVNIGEQGGTIRKIQKSEEGFYSFGFVVASSYNKDLKTPEVLRVDYAGAPKTFLTFPISDFLANKVPERIYKDKIVLIGATAPDLHDFFQTPFGLMPGVEIHANVINTLLHQNFYKNIPFGVSAIIILIFCILAAVLISKVDKFSKTVLYLTLLFMLLNLLAILLFRQKIIFPVLYADLGFVGVSVMLILFQYALESKEKKFIHNSFKHYLAPDVIDELILDPTKLKLGGERKKVTILFSDIRGFTTISEKLTPEQLTHVLNEYLTEMTDIVIEHKGLVDKYIGDAVMAFWGAPILNNNQALDACLSAVNMIKALDSLNEHWKSREISNEFKIGVGINTGEVVVGNLGSKTRFNYTVIGDEVNLCSRLEGLNKVYGSEIIITESTKKAVEHDSRFQIRELDLITVKGKKEPKIIFEIMTKPLDKNILDHFNLGRQLYKEGKWNEAIAHFAIGAEVDGPTKLYLERCQYLQEHPPESWNGVYEFKTK
ncbi:adenylate/guanylate cyclase domain-containing protein [Candidatus Parcubacteria bacterium]|nr:adenylate/guanylate cyclase domain-containing protein [Candidatus Parcubacteria bacterium]